MKEQLGMKKPRVTKADKRRTVLKFLTQDKKKSQRHFAKNEGISESTFRGWIKDFRTNKLEKYTTKKQLIVLNQEVTITSFPLLESILQHYLIRENFVTLSADKPDLDIETIRNKCYEWACDIAQNSENAYIRLLYEKFELTEAWLEMCIMQAKKALTTPETDNEADSNDDQTVHSFPEEPFIVNFNKFAADSLDSEDPHVMEIKKDILRNEDQNSSALDVLLKYAQRLSFDSGKAKEQSAFKNILKMKEI